jgi:hypothetical protein
MTVPFAADVAQTTAAESTSINSSAIQIPASFADDCQLAEIVGLCNQREVSVGSSIYPFFYPTHARQVKGNKIADILRDTLTTIVDSANKDVALSDAYKRLVELYMDIFSLHTSRIKSPDGEAVYRYDARTLNCTFDWLESIVSNKETSPEGKVLRVFHLLTDPDFGSPDFISDVKNNELTLESAPALFKFLQERRPSQVLSYSLTVDDCTNLIYLLNSI